MPASLSSSRPSLAELAHRGGTQRARLYPRTWQVLLMEYARARRDHRTRFKTFRTYLRSRGFNEEELLQRSRGNGHD